MIKVKYVPNAVTLSRLVLCFALIFIRPILGTVSFIVYCIAGVTDMIDGPLARRIPDGQSKLGANLDAMADMCMIIVGVFVLMPAMNIWSWEWPAVIAILIFKIASASISGMIKHGKVLFTHTKANKYAAMFLFIGPILYFILGAGTIVNSYIVFLIVWVFLCTVEEAVINLSLDHPNTDIEGFWKIKEENAKNK